MGELTIYNALRSAGLSPAGAAGVMGNMYCESLLQSNNVENRCTMSDEDYTANVDRGAIPQSQFVHDTYGYGLCQWTYYSRKQELINLAKSKGVSIADEAMQCELCVKELKRDYPALFSFLCTTSDVYTSASRVCCEYERPAVNNIGPRAAKAQELYAKYSGVAVTAPQSSTGQVNTAQPEIKQQSTDSCKIAVRVLRRGDMGRDVFMLQCGLNDAGFTCGVADGDFGALTVCAVNQVRAAIGLIQNGVADEDVWQYLFQ